MSIVKTWNRILIEGGPGSGNFGHSGRPGEVGGSGSGGKSGGPRYDRMWKQPRPLSFDEEEPRHKGPPASKEDVKAFRVLGTALSAGGVGRKDIKYIQYRATKRGVSLQDREMHFGHTTGFIDKEWLGEEGMTVDKFVKSLVKHGATKIPPQKRHRSFSYYD